MELVEIVAKNVLLSLYQTVWFSVLLSVLFMFYYMYAHGSGNSGKGWISAAKTWISEFKRSKQFRRVFLFSFVVTMILFKTLLNREYWMNPLSDVIGTWSIYKIDPLSGETSLSTECLENIVLFIPFSLLLCGLEKHEKKKDCIFYGVKISFFFSLGIEFFQLFLRVGTFQLSDLFFNTTGGFIGVLVYGLIYQINKHFS